MSAERPTAETLRVRGAAVHNLKQIDVEIPLHQFVVVTGVSGSGKSSLVFDTIATEGRRRFLVTLSRGSRPAASFAAAPDVDLIEGIPPILSLTQYRGAIDSRQTLASLADLASSLRLLFANIGTAHCPQCGRRVERQTTDEIVDRILRLEERKKVMILAPVVRHKTGAHRELLEKLAAAGFVRIRIDGEIHEADALPELKPRARHNIEIVIDRIIVKSGIRDRLIESVALALREGDETCLISEQTDAAWDDRLYSARYACPDCDLSFPPLEPRSFNPSSPYGACMTCAGSGVTGDDETCPDCEGTRLSDFVRNVQLLERTYLEILGLTVREAADFFNTAAPPTDSEKEQRILELVLPEVRQRLACLCDLGLHYLTLDRSAVTLSGGEHQRARIAAVLAGGLTDVCYLLDEPTAGLHATDAENLVRILERLRDGGNSVIAIEHDPVLFAGADWLIELGPGAGPQGGELIANGTPDDFRERGTTPTERVLAGTMTRSQPELRTGRGFVEVSGAWRHNLDGIDVRFPLQALTCVAGVSGSGKSTLIHDVIVPTLRERLAGNADALVNCKGLTGAESLEAVRLVDQSPLGRNGRSNPATATGAWNEIRRIFAGSRPAKLRGFRASRFSFLSSEGRCPACKGRGEVVHRLPLLPEVRSVCPTCRGRRFNPQTLSVEYKGRSIADCLEMTIDEALDFFESFPVLAQRLRTLSDLGLGYLQLGQPAPSLSGGEAQRIRLAAELGKLNVGPTLYLLDEPTSGLHPHDIGRLLDLLNRIVDEGHTVLTIEHQPDVLSAADWIIDLGPGAGPDGGQVVATGPPEEIRSCAKSRTAAVLR